MFRRLFRQPASAETIQDCVRLVGAFAAATFSATAASHPALAEMRRDLLTLFTFGGVHVLSQKRRLDQAEAHAVAIATYMKHLGWSDNEAVVKAQGAISAAGPDGYPNLKAVIHKGIEGFLAWERQPHGYSARDYADALDAFDRS